MAEGKLSEVERDAMRIQTKRFKDDAEERQYKLEQETEESGDPTPPVEKPEPEEPPVPPSDKKGK